MIEAVAGKMKIVQYYYHAHQRYQIYGPNTTSHLMCLIFLSFRVNGLFHYEFIVEVCGNSTDKQLSNEN